MNSVRRNIIANYLGAAWSALMGLAFIPLYIRYLGMEGYGLIGVFTLLQSWLALLDLGLTPTLSREMARFQAGKHSPQSIRDLMCSVERVYFVIAVLIVVAVFLSAHWVATDWIHTQKMSVASITDALSITGCVIALRWLVGLYRNALVGLQRQVWLNSCTSVFSTFRGAGAVGILAWLSPTITAFFVYQGVLFALEAFVLASSVRRSLPRPPNPARFTWKALQQIWRFAAGMAFITLMSILLVQVDKVLLSKLLPLTEFGYYVLASTVAGALGLIIGPINNAIYPRLTEIIARDEIKLLATDYHRFSQMLTLMLAPAALVLSLFSDYVLLGWTRDPDVARSVAPLVRVLAIGTLLNGLMHTPYSLQLAHGWTRFTAILNTASVLIIVPGIYFSVHAYGAIAAAYVWVILNAGYILIAIPIMHRRLLPGEMWKWYGQDVFGPLLAGLSAGVLVRAFVPRPLVEKPWASALVLSLATVATLSAVAIATPMARARVRRYLFSNAT
jgi:O-antigen/teichoic acid export membrane protein